MMDTRRSRIVFFLALMALLSAGIVAERFSAFDETDKMHGVFADRIVTHLMKGLVFEHHLPRVNGGHLPDTSAVVYILGGMQEGMRNKCKTVGRLYAEGAARNVLILHRSGITEYSPPHPSIPSPKPG